MLTILKAMWPVLFMNALLPPFIIFVLRHLTHPNRHPDRCLLVPFYCYDENVLSVTLFFHTNHVTYHSCGMMISQNRVSIVRFADNLEIILKVHGPTIEPNKVRVNEKLKKKQRSGNPTLKTKVGKTKLITRYLHQNIEQLMEPQQKFMSSRMIKV